MVFVAELKLAFPVQLIVAFALLLLLYFRLLEEKHGNEEHLKLSAGRHMEVLIQ
jgi:hypothetical protein